MPLSVWLTVVLLTISAGFILYWVFRAGRAFMEARREATQKAPPSERRAAFEQHRAEAASAAARAVESQQARTSRAAASPTPQPAAKQAGEAAADADIERALAELEGKVTSPSKARIDPTKGGDPQGSSNVQHRPAGAPGDSRDRPPGGGA